METGIAWGTKKLREGEMPNLLPRNSNKIVLNCI